MSCIIGFYFLVVVVVVVELFKPLGCSHVRIDDFQ